MLIALTRPLSPQMGHCELTYLPRVEIDIERARAQHQAYEITLAALGCALVPLPAEPALPDSVFVEDTAVMLDEIAILTRPGAVSRRPETASVALALRNYRKLVFIQAPGILDGGDVLRVDKTLYVGSSSRTNEAGIVQLTAAAAPYGYRVVAVPLAGCLHLKSAVTRVDGQTLLINRHFVDPLYFPGMEFIEVAEDEPGGANALLLGTQVIYSVAFPRTRARLEQKGIAVRGIDVSEMEKAEGAVTCCSLIFEADSTPS